MKISKMIGKKLSAAVLLLICCFMVTACSGSESTSDGSGTTAASSSNSNGTGDSQSASSGTQTAGDNAAADAAGSSASADNASAQSGSSAGSDSTEAADSTAESGSSAAADSYSFIYNNVTITPGAQVDPIVEAIGEDYKYYESPSCAYVGLDKVYMYSGFCIYTYPDDNAVDYVLQIVFTDDSVTTPEGLMLGSKDEKVTSLYGSDRTEIDGSYQYTRGVTTLQILMDDNGRVKSIMYGLVQ